MEHGETCGNQRQNVLNGEGKSITYGQILAELVIELPGGLEITSLITRTSANRMKIVVGKSVTTIVKGSNAKVAVD